MALQWSLTYSQSRTCMAVAIDRQRLARQGVDDHQRDQLFGKVVRAVVVGAVGGEHRQAVGVVVGAHQVVAGGLAGRVGAVGLVAVGFGEGRVVLAQRAIDLVGGHMQKAEGRFGLVRQAAPVGAHGFQQAEGADDIGLDEVLGAVDGAVHMRLSAAKLTTARGWCCGQQAGHQRAVANVALHKDMARIALQAGQVFQVARVGQLVEVDHRLVATAPASPGRNWRR